MSDQESMVIALVAAERNLDEVLHKYGHFWHRKERLGLMIAMEQVSCLRASIQQGDVRAADLRDFHYRLIDEGLLDVPIVLPRNR